MIRIEVYCDVSGIEVEPSRIEELGKAVCARHGVAQGTVSIAVVTDENMQQINRRFLRREGTTDCISFDLSDETDEPIWEIVVNGEKALHEAKARGHAPAGELALYITHGLLHYLGFDDANSAQAERMHAEEDAILRALGYGGIYRQDVSC